MLIGFIINEQSLCFYLFNSTAFNFSQLKQIEAKKANTNFFRSNSTYNTSLVETQNAIPSETDTRSNSLYNVDHNEATLDTTRLIIATSNNNTDSPDGRKYEEETQEIIFKDKQFSGRAEPNYQPGYQQTDIYQNPANQFFNGSMSTYLSGYFLKTKLLFAILLAVIFLV